MPDSGFPAQPTTIFAGQALYIDEVADSTDRTVVAGGTAVKVRLLSVDNTKNKNAACFVKLYNAAIGDVTVGSTVPWLIFKVPAGQMKQFTCPIGNDAGTDLSVAVVATGGTGGSASPVNDVLLTVFVND